MAASLENKRSAWEVFLAFLRLGLTSFGGPVAHLGYFREELVTRRRWLSESSYADLVALCQFLPGPASSQVGMALGLSRTGYAGALAAWAGFTLPSAILLILFALSITAAGNAIPQGLLHGLKIVAVAVVAQAVWGMARSLCTDKPRILLMTLAAVIALTVPSVWAQVSVILAAGAAGMLLLGSVPSGVHEPLPIPVRPAFAIGALTLFLALLLGLPLLAQLYPDPALQRFDGFYRAGSLVFGGGHIVLPLLQAEVVPSGLVSRDSFLAGYGVVQAMPGPLFTFAAFLGASMSSGPSGWLGGLLCLVAIFLPSFLMVVGALPYWEQLRRNTRAQAALAGINAAVVGLLLAALYLPVWTSAIFGPSDVAFALTAFVALLFWKLPPWLVVLASGALGWLLERFV